jgi:hypothetical protein
MRLRIPCLTAVTWLVLGTASAATAQVIPSPYRFIDTSQSFGAALGYASTGDGALGLGPESAIQFMAYYGLRLSGPITLEGSLTFLPSERMVWDTIPGDTMLQVVGRSKMNLATLSGAIRFNVTGSRTYRRIQPYVVLGGGLVIDLSPTSIVESELPENVRLDFGTRLSGQLGGGADIFFSEGFSLRLDARNVAWKLTTPMAFLLGEPALYRPPDQWVQNFYLSAGVNIHF